MATRTTIPKPHTGTIVSIGYEGKTLDDFLGVLRRNRVDVLVDVRLNAISRKKGFSKKALGAALEDVGIEYLHVPELGNPKENRDPFRNGQAATGRRVFLAHLNNGSREAYDEVVELARAKRIALLCVEHDDRQCHRGCITDQAQDENPALSVVRA